MAKFNEGINGPFQGKVGRVVGANWKGIPYMRSLPKKRTSPPTAGELANRKKWVLTQRWLKPIQDFVRIGFKGYSLRSEGFVAAKSYLLKNAITGEGETLAIDPALVKLSWGNLPLPENLQMTRLEGKRVQFTWDPLFTHELSHKGDQIMMLAYNVEKDRAVSNPYGQVRAHGFDILEIDTSKTGTFHIYVAFVAHDRSRQSESVYFSTIEI
ncbi:hypothetical protein A4H97_16160 [Niastella yeongjuensis]|uniref:Uncharacterized protein n=1 Tax=Niastella yeongjuensis TaxID=354355 RepID=A0A1V9E0V4_9BACT|nr:DUF6266 family protein [Niastella yeongjuensis]OQP39758.1 hypothetical protein A4H97_16160 [Niastella yeongjuensis]SEO04345.1 hypothetical protein SAMN05660816_01979 [Niastella yeongjuensis]